MAPYWLTDALIFPPAESSTADGLVAVGGDASPERLILAYSQGIFPWPIGAESPPGPAQSSEDAPLLWFSPDPRFILPLTHCRVSRSLRKAIRATTLTIRADSAFTEVMHACAQAPRDGQDGTWITGELIDGFTALHTKGVAHSIEAFDGTTLVGGLYGISLGRAFFGESMFARQPDASKIAFVTLLGNLIHWGFDFVDCQVPTGHLARFGAQAVPRREFLQLLKQSLQHAPRTGRWQLELQPAQALDAVRGLTVASESR